MNFIVRALYMYCSDVINMDLKLLHHNTSEIYKRL